MASTGGDRSCDHAICCLLAFTVAFTITILLLPDYTYSVAIDSVSGLDNPATAAAAAAGALNPEFNLTLRVASSSEVRRACIGPRAYLEVRYICATLATTEISTEELCAGPRESAERHVVARGTGVRLPGYVLDSLMADARRGGVEVFAVALRRHADDGGGVVVTEGCGIRRVGHAATALRDGDGCVESSMATCTAMMELAAGWDKNFSNFQDGRT